MTAHAACGLGRLDHLAREPGRFADVIDAAAPGAPASSCPGWTTPGR